MNAFKIMGAAVLLLFVLNLVSVSLLFRMNRPFGHPGRPAAAGEFLMRELKFNADQRKAYLELIQEHRKNIQGLEKKRADLRHAFFAGISQSDTSALPALRQVEGEFELLTFRHFQAVRQLATPQQQVRFDQIIQEVIRRMAPPGPRGPKPLQHG